MVTHLFVFEHKTLETWMAIHVYAEGAEQAERITRAFYQEIREAHGTVEAQLSTEEELNHLFKRTFTLHHQSARITHQAHAKPLMALLHNVEGLNLFYAHEMPGVLENKPEMRIERVLL